MVGIFLGNITKWNDPKIAALNPGVELPDIGIIPVHRSDGSGTTFIFTDFLSSVSPVWAGFGGQRHLGEMAGHHRHWRKGNEGVAGQVKQLSGAVGYVELIYAKQNQMSYADIKNAAAISFRPRSIRSRAALATAKIPTISGSRWSTRPATTRIRSPARPGCWFMRGKRTPIKGRKLVEFLNWAVRRVESYGRRWIMPRCRTPAAACFGADRTIKY